MVDSFGARVRRYREDRGISVAEIADKTKIKASLLEGLERDDISQWPNGIFRRAYVRAYATAIGADPDGIVREFLALYPDPVESLEPQAPPTLFRSLVDSAFGSLRLRAARSAPPLRPSASPSPAVDATTATASKGSPDAVTGRTGAEEETIAVDLPLDGHDDDSTIATAPPDDDSTIATPPPVDVQADDDATVDDATVPQVAAPPSHVTASGWTVRSSGSRVAESESRVAGPASRVAGPESQVSGHESRVADAQSEATRTGSADFLGAAKICTELGRVDDIKQVPPLLRDAAKVLDARGLIVWVWDSSVEQLRPALVHGYSRKVRARLRGVSADADNVTAAAYRSGAPLAVGGHNGTSAALAIPLLAPAACAGVLAIELNEGREQDPAVRAMATFFAAMLAQLVGTVSDTRSASAADARGAIEARPG